MTAVSVRPSDLQARYEGDIDEYDDDYLTTLISDAEDIIDVEVPAAQKRLDAGTLSPSMYTKVVCDMVLRVIRNPDGYRSEQAGDASVSRFTMVSSGDLWLTDRDIARLTGAGSTQMPGTIRIGSAGWSCGAPRW